MMTAKLVLAFVVSGSFAKANEYRPSAFAGSDATQAEILWQIDKGVLDFYPAIGASGNWVIYPEDHPRIAVSLADRRTTMEPKKIAEGEIETEFGEDPDVDAILVQ